MNYYIADWHYGHANVMAYDNRPFKSVEEMNEALVTLWNETVKDDDTVYILGDMFWGSVAKYIPILRGLHGKKVLIRGNHDKTKFDLFNAEFEGIYDYLEIKDEDKNVVLCHYPIPCFKNHFYGWIHLYGHVHDSFEEKMTEHDKYLMEELYGEKCRMYNVGAMMPYINYVPRTLEEILGATEK